jgi:hypothetical protein
MTSHSLRDAIVDLARDGTALPGTRAAIDSHVEHCRSCAAILTRERQLSQGLRALAAATSADGASDALGRRLLEVFAERQPADASTVSFGWRGTRSRWLRAAAALLIVAGSSALWLRARRDPVVESTPSAHDMRADVRTAPPAPRPAETQAADPPRPTPVVAGGHRPHAARNRTAPASHVVRPVGFVTLPGAAGLPDFESGQIIRMEIPLASLPTYGIEIPPDAQGTPVAADLLVGQDGQARAIRLVNEEGDRR